MSADRVTELLEELTAWLDRAGAPLPPQLAPLRDQPFGARLHLEGRPGPWTELRLSQHPARGPALWLQGTRRTLGPASGYLPPSVDWAVRPVVAALLDALDGDVLEWMSASAGRHPILPRSTLVHPPGWWDDWRDRPSGEGDGRTIGDVYRDELWPGAREALAAHGARRILDLGAGDGAFAATLPGDPELVLVERNASAVARAREALPRARSLCADLRDPSAWEGLGTFDAVVAVGLLECGAMSPDDAEALVPRVAAALRPGGLAVVTGFGPCLVESDSWEAHGLRVSGYSHRAAPQLSLRSRYILHREARSRSCDDASS